MRVPGLNPVEQMQIPEQKNIVAFATLFLGMLAFRGLIPYQPFPALLSTDSQFEDWFFRPTGQSAGLIFGLTACFLYARYRRFAAAVRNSAADGWPLGIALLPFAALFYFWGIYVGAPDLQLISLVLFCLGAAVLWGGRAGFQVIAFPLLFLLLLIPIPAVIANQIVYPLQLFNAHWAAFVLDLWPGIDVSHSGTFVSTEWRRFQVIESCAGLRTISTLVMSALVYAEIFHRGPLQTALLLVLAPLIGLLVNFGRVLSLMLNPAGEIAALHSLQGVVMMVVGVLLLAGLDRVLIRFIPGETSAAGPGRIPGVEGEVRARASARHWLVLALLAALALGSFIVHPWEPTRMLRRAPYGIPSQWAGWRGRPIEIDKNAMGSVAPDRWIHRLYEKGSAEVEVFVATDELSRRGSSLLSPKTVLPESGFEILEQEVVAVPGLDVAVEASVLQGEFERALSYRWVTGASGIGVEALRLFLGVDRSDWVTPRRLILVRISTPVGQSVRSRSRAEARLREFAGFLAPSLDEMARPEAL